MPEPAPHTGWKVPPPGPPLRPAPTRSPLWARAALVAGFLSSLGTLRINFQWAMALADGAPMSLGMAAAMGELVFAPLGLLLMGAGVMGTVWRWRSKAVWAVAIVLWSMITFGGPELIVRLSLGL